MSRGEEVLRAAHGYGAPSEGGVSLTALADFDRILRTMAGISADVVIVGGGLAGMASSYYLAKARGVRGLNGPGRGCCSTSDSLAG